MEASGQEKLRRRRMYITEEEPLYTCLPDVPTAYAVEGDESVLEERLHHHGEVFPLQNVSKGFLSLKKSQPRKNQRSATDLEATWMQTPPGASLPPAPSFCTGGSSMATRGRGWGRWGRC